MEKNNSLFKNYIYNLLSQLLTLLLPMITAPYLARVLMADGNGQIAFANSIVAYFSSFAGFGFSVYGQREIAKYKDDKEKVSEVFEELFFLRLVFSLIAFLGLIVLILSPFITNQYKGLVLINSIQIIAVIFDIQFFYQGMEDFKSIAIRTIIVRVISIICVFGLVRDQNDVWVYLLYSSIVALLANLIMWPKAVQTIYWKQVTFQNIKRHIQPCFFIFLPILSGTIFSVLDSTMIGYMAIKPDYENGCYGSAIKLINIISIIIMADGQVLASRNARDYAIRNYDALFKHIKLGFRYVWAVGIPIIVGQFLLADRISIWFFGEGYEKVPLLLQIFTLRVITHGIMNVIGNQYLLPTGREKVCTSINFVGILINIVLNFVLIPVYGCIGAALASVSSELVLIGLYFCYLIRENKYWNLSMILQSWKYILSASLMGLLVYLFKVFLNYSFISLALMICVGVVAYAVNLLLLRDEMVIIYGKKMVVDQFEKLRRKFG